MQHAVTTTIQPLVLTEAEAAARLLTCPRTLARWRCEGKGPRFVKIGRRVAYRESDLIAYLDEQTRQRTGRVVPIRSKS